LFDVLIAASQLLRLFDDSGIHREQVIVPVPATRWGATECDATPAATDDI
jgi:hypothetical protein